MGFNFTGLMVICICNFHQYKFQLLDTVVRQNYLRESFNSLCILVYSIMKMCMKHCMLEIQSSFHTNKNLNLLQWELIDTTKYAIKFHIYKVIRYGQI